MPSMTSPRAAICCTAAVRCAVVELPRNWTSTVPSLVSTADCTPGIVFSLAIVASTSALATPAFGVTRYSPTSLLSGLATVLGTADAGAGAASPGSSVQADRDRTAARAPAESSVQRGAGERTIRVLQRLGQRRR